MKYTIQTLNEIASVIHDVLKPEKYAISREATDPDAILLRSANMHEMEFGDKLLAIGRAGAGVNNIPVDRCSKDGIIVFNTPGANSNAVKEMALGMLLLVNRNILESIQWTNTLKDKGSEVPKLVEKGKSQFVGNEIKGKTLGVIGLGAIGGPLASAAVDLGMNVLGYDPYMSVNSAWKISSSVKWVSEDELIASSDYISFHAPLNNETRGKINKDFLAKMKSGATILNFSRAELAATTDVIEALNSGKLRSYVVDFPTDDMIGVENAVCIPHLASSTEESEDNCALMAASQIADYLENGNIKNSVNFPDCTMPRSASAKCRIAVMHDNIPNTIGSITSVVAGTGINIANMQNNSKGNLAYTLLDLDADSVCAETRKTLEKLDGIIKVRTL